MRKITQHLLLRWCWISHEWSVCRLKGLFSSRNPASEPAVSSAQTHTHTHPCFTEYFSCCCCCCGPPPTRCDGGLNCPLWLLRWNHCPSLKLVSMSLNSNFSLRFFLLLSAQLLWPRLLWLIALVFSSVAVKTHLHLYLYCKVVGWDRTQLVVTCEPPQQMRHVASLSFVLSFFLSCAPAHRDSVGQLFLVETPSTQSLNSVGLQIFGQHGQSPFDLRPPALALNLSCEAAKEQSGVFRFFTLVQIEKYQRDGVSVLEPPWSVDGILLPLQSLWHVEFNQEGRDDRWEKLTLCCDVRRHASLHCRA